MILRRLFRLHMTLKHMQIGRNVRQSHKEQPSLDEAGMKHHLLTIISLKSFLTYMEVWDVLSIQWLFDRKLSGDWVDDEDAGGWLVSARARHTVSQQPVFVVIWPDLQM